MNSPFALPVLLRCAGVVLAAASLALGLAAPAGAEQCPRGQILWKSKNKCVEKAEAAKLGFYHGPIPATKDKADDAPPETAVEPTPAASVTPPPVSEAAPPAAAAQPKPSPYGELVIEEFARAK